MGLIKKLIKNSYRLRMKFSKSTGLGISVKSNTKNMKAPVSFYELQATANTGQQIQFEKYRGKKILIVNLASKCGFTPQYNELEKLNKEYGDKVTILGFPSDDFGGQEPGSDSEIAEFCKINFGVTFQLFHKDQVKGSGQQPVYDWLSDAAKNGWNNEEPTWNFCKYLVNESGDLQKFYSSSVSPMGEEILKEI